MKLLPVLSLFILMNFLFDLFPRLFRGKSGAFAAAKRALLLLCPIVTASFAG